MCVPTILPNYKNTIQDTKIILKQSNFEYVVMVTLVTRDSGVLSTGYVIKKQTIYS